MTNNRVAIVAGGAGFIGSHLCDALMCEQMTVICVDNLFTGRMENIAHLLDHPRFTFINADVSEPLPSSLSADRVRNGFIYNLACPASPPALPSRSGTYAPDLHHGYVPPPAPCRSIRRPLPASVDERDLRRS